MTALPSTGGQGTRSVVTVVTLGADDGEAARAYEALVAAAPASPITHGLVWRDLLQGLGLGEPIYWLALRDGRPRAALPAFVRRAPSGAVLNSLPLVQSAGGVITPGDAGPDERAGLVKLLVAAMLDHCRAHDVRVACVVGPPYRGLDDQAAFPEAATFRMVRTTNVLDLSRPLDPRPSVLGSVQKAEAFAPRHHVAATLAEARAVHALYAASMQRLGVPPHPWALYEPLFGRGARFVWAEVNGAPASALVLLIHGEVVEYLSVGNSDAGRAMQTNSWLCLRELEWARAQGLRWWNWGASPTPAVHDFKKRWGGEDRPFPIWGWCLGDVAAWRALTPRALAAEFPSYFVLPYDQLRSA